MTRKRNGVILVAGVGVAALALAACGGSSTSSESSAAASEAPASEAPASEAPASEAPASEAPAAEGDLSWCGPNEAIIGMTDGFGGNSWRLVTTAAGQDEAAKCASVTEFLYADGQGDVNKAISDIQSMVAQGVNGLVVFPDAGEAVLPALRSAYEAGVVTVPYRVTPGGESGVDYTTWIGTDFQEAGRNWGEWILEVLPEGGNVLMLSGPAGNSQGEEEAIGLKEVLEPTGKYTFIGEQPFEVTNWDPAETQKVLTAAIAKYPQIDVIVSDFGPSLVGALPEFTKAGKPIPALATSDGNVLGCFWAEQEAAGNGFPLMTVSTQNDHVRLAMQHAIALATGGQVPELDAYPSYVFEDSTDSDPNPVACEPDLPGDIYLSAEMSGADQAALMQ